MRAFATMILTASLFTMTMTSAAFAEGFVSDAIETFDKASDLIDTADTVKNIAEDGAKDLVDSAVEWAGNKMNGGSVEVEELDVTSNNTINGSITATDNSHVGVGDVELQNVKVTKMTINTDNQTQSIEAKDKSQVLVGSVRMHNYKGNTVSIKTTNKVNGKITAKNKSTVRVGAVVTK